MQELSTLQAFEYWLTKLVARLKQQKRGAAPFALMQMATGLRSAEVLEFGRWSDAGHEQLTVQLAKREAQRTFSRQELPPEWLAAYEARGGLYSYNYGAYEHDLQAAGISFVFNGDKRKTTSHAFRYFKFRQLFDKYGNIAQVQTEMAHKSAGSTMYYLLDKASVQDSRPELG